MKKVLIVEDDEFLADIYRREFVADGYEADIASDGEAATELLGNGQYDLVLLDIMLPKKDGLSLLTEIKKDPTTNKIPIVILSNLSQDATIKQALSLGAAGYLVKAQFLPKQAVAEVKKYLLNLDLK